MVSASDVVAPRPAAAARRAAADRGARSNGRPASSPGQRRAAPRAGSPAAPTGPPRAARRAPPAGSPAPARPPARRRPCATPRGGARSPPRQSASTPRSQRPFDAQRHRDVVERAARLELIDEPEALLGERQGQRSLPRRGPEADARLAPLRSAAASTRAARSATAGPRRDRAAASRRRRLAQARHHPRRQQRVAAQVEEVVVHPDPFEPEELGPDAGEDLFDRRARRGGGLRARRRNLPRVRLGFANRHRAPDRRRGRVDLVGRRVARRRESIASSPTGCSGCRAISTRTCSQCVSSRFAVSGA